MEGVLRCSRSLGALLAFALAVAACGGGGEPAGPADAGGGTTTTLPTATTAGPSSDIPFTGIPDDFPSDEIPLVDGDYIVAGPGDAGVWVVRARVDAPDTQQARQQAGERLVGAGFEEKMPGMQYESGSWTVILQTYEDGGAVWLSYSIAPR
jgi:hypothetical protein